MEKIKVLLDVFHYLDANGDCRLEKHEIVRGIQSHQKLRARLNETPSLAFLLQTSAWTAMLVSMDTKQQLFITFTEFYCCVAMLQSFVHTADGGASSGRLQKTKSGRRLLAAGKQSAEEQAEEAMQKAHPLYAGWLVITGAKPAKYASKLFKKAFSTKFRLGSSDNSSEGGDYPNGGEGGLVNGGEAETTSPLSDATGHVTGRGTATSMTLSKRELLRYTYTLNNKLLLVSLNFIAKLVSLEPCC